MTSFGVLDFGGERWHQYVRELRETWPPRPELHPAETGGETTDFSQTTA
ncbi:hypothetical protein [Halorussus aquaticus]|uniref:Uncharacterized protein n=1 Tax=Halorussus aquaticus TaxID=2953748 RepID=A0ABD5PY69_9EURY|nr:hypothetical protein [Halorussus aquaticus]